MAGPIATYGKTDASLALLRESAGRPAYRPTASAALRVIAQGVREHAVRNHALPSRVCRVAGSGAPGVHVTNEREAAPTVV